MKPCGPISGNFMDQMSSLCDQDPNPFSGEAVPKLVNPMGQVVTTEDVQLLTHNSTDKNWTMSVSCPLNMMN